MKSLALRRWMLKDRPPLTKAAAAGGRLWDLNQKPTAASSTPQAARTRGLRTEAGKVSQLLPEAGRAQDTSLQKQEAHLGPGPLPTSWTADQPISDVKQGRNRLLLGLFKDQRGGDEPLPSL